MRELVSIEEQLKSATKIKVGLLEVTRVIAIYHHVIVILLSRVQIQQNCVHGDKMRGIHGFTRMTSVGVTVKPICLYATDAKLKVEERSDSVFVIYT